MGMCINPAIFGPYFWTVIHLACLTAGTDVSDEKASDMTMFFKSLPGVLPCLHCAEHLKTNLIQLPFDRLDPFRWSVQLHNNVNAQLAKKQVSYEDALKYWEEQCKDDKPPQTPWLVIILVVLVVFGMVFR